MPILDSPQERALVRSIIGIARSLGVETVAEGVETMQHAAMLRELGCDLLQGYAFARPLPFAEFTQTALLRSTTEEATDGRPPKRSWSPPPFSIKQTASGVEKAGTPWTTRYVAKQHRSTLPR